MRAIEVMLAPEERGGFVQPYAIQCRQVLWQAVDFLIDIVFHQVNHVVELELLVAGRPPPEAL